MNRRTVPPSLAWSLRINPFMSRLLVLTVAVLTTFILLALFRSPLHQLEERLGALAWIWFPETETEQRITIIGIDEQSLAQIGSWPWPRETLLKLSNNLAAAGASQQIYDIVLPESRSGDAALAKGLGSQQAILAQIPLLQSQQSLQAGVMSNAIQGMQCQPPIPSTQHFLANAGHYQHVAKGHITPIVDGDGMIRRVPPLICVEGRVYPSLALTALLQGLGIDRQHLTADQLRLMPGKGFWAPAWQLTLSHAPHIVIPLDAQGNMRINYHHATSSYALVSAADVLSQPPENIALDHTWALIGATAFGLGDVVPTPQSGLTPGVELQARMLSSLLDHQVPYSPVNAVWIQWSVGAVVLFILLGLASRGGKTGFVGLPLVGLIAPCMLLAVHGGVLLHSVLWLGWLPVSLFAILGSLSLLLLEYGRVRHERMRVYSNLSSYLPEHVAHEIAFRQPNDAISAKRQTLIVLCADIRNYSAYQECRTPEEAATLLHCFFVEAANIVETQQGSIHEFKGDALIATWSADNAPWALAQALGASVSLINRMQDILPQHVQPGLEPMSVGVGLEMGESLVGSIGPAHRRHHALMGRPLTAALRIQSMTAEVGQPILVGECAVRRAAQVSRMSAEGSHTSQLPYQLKSQGAYMLEGIRKPVELYALPPGTLPDPTLPDMDAHTADLRLIHGALTGQ